MDLSVGDFALAALLLGLTGWLFATAVRKPRSPGYRAAAVVLGVAAIAAGELDDAPGLELFGCVLVVGAIALTVRLARRRA